MRRSEEEASHLERSRISFSKMHGLGNDFVIIDAVRQSVNLSPEEIRLLADRHFGVGCDQVLLVERAARAPADFRYRIFNSDGSEAEQCGNGARCFTRFVLDQGLTSKKSLALETRGGMVLTRLEDDGEVTVQMAIPDFDPAAVPFVAERAAAVYAVEVNGEVIELQVVSMGNPHAVLLVDDVSTAPVQRLGPLLERHERFPRRVNVGFMQVIDDTRIRLRVYERGVGETLACGSGACAAVAAGRQRGLLAERVLVELPGGRLSVRWPGPGQPVELTGPATEVYEGTIAL
jgi:diaminopimelate epimerase